MSEEKKLAINTSDILVSAKPDEWVCEACLFINPVTVPVCVTCARKNPRAPPPKKDNYAVGDAVLVHSQTAKALIRYIGPVDETKGVWYGVECEKPVGSSDGAFKGKKYFNCKANHGLFLRLESLAPFDENVQAVGKIQRAFRKRKAPSDADEKAPPLRSVTTPDVLKHGRRLSNLVDKMRPHRAVSQDAMSHQAALRIQRMFRAFHARHEAKSRAYWKTWEELDTKEENDLMQTHQQYEALLEKAKAAYLKKLEEKKKAEADEIKEGMEIVSRMKSGINIEPKPELIVRHVTSKIWPLLPIKGMSMEYIKEMISHYQLQDKAMPREDVIEVINRVIPILRAEPNVVSVKINVRCTVVGDLHGQLDDLLHIFTLNGYPSERNQYVFNGDFVDRGQSSVEVMMILLCLKLLHPNNVFLNRGNHESRDINARDGFEREMTTKYDVGLFDLMSKLFACLPFALVIQNMVFVVHGGLFNEDYTLDDLMKIDRFTEIPVNKSLLQDALWSDPFNGVGRKRNKRGAGLTFGADVVDTFRKKNKVQLIIRSHQYPMNGYEWRFDKKLITIFSASNYCGKIGNYGSFMILEKDLKYSVVPFKIQQAAQFNVRYSVRYRAVVEDILTKLSVRIVHAREKLLEYYAKVEIKDPAQGAVGTITREQWAEGLRECLGINVPFLQFQVELGLPTLGVKGKEKGEIDYHHFLSQFTHVNLSLPQEATNAEPSQVEKDWIALAERITDVLFMNRHELASVFRYFDKNKDGSVSIEEFVDAVSSLRELMQIPFDDKQIHQIAVYLDKDKNGTISYNEFFDNFRVATPLLWLCECNVKHSRTVTECAVCHTKQPEAPSTHVVAGRGSKGGKV